MASPSTKIYNSSASASDYITPKLDYITATTRNWPELKVKLRSSDLLSSSEIQILDKYLDDTSRFYQMYDWFLRNPNWQDWTNKLIDCLTHSNNGDAAEEIIQCCNSHAEAIQMQIQMSQLKLGPNQDQNEEKTRKRELELSKALVKSIQMLYDGTKSNFEKAFSYIISLDLKSSKKICIEALVEAMSTCAGSYGHAWSIEMIRLAHYAKTQCAYVRGVAKNFNFPHEVIALVWNEDSYIRLRNTVQTLALDSNAQKQVYTHDINDCGNQKWRVALEFDCECLVGECVSLALNLTNKKTKKVLDSNAAGKVYTKKQNNSGNQQWEIVPIGVVTHEERSWYFLKLKNKATGMYLDSHNEHNHLVYTSEERENEESSQIWTLIPPEY